jgi:hypothetical protein
MTKYFLCALLLININASGQSQNSFVFSHSTLKSVSVEFKTSKKMNDIVWGAGISYFYNKGNKGKDYTGFVTDYNASSYEKFLAKEGSIFVTIGNKINEKLLCNFRFGMGVVTNYYNGVGLPTMPTELWYVRKRGFNDILLGLNFQYNIRGFTLSGGWDNFNKINLGLGFNFTEK